MGEWYDDLDPEMVYSLYAGGFKTGIVRIALLLDVFTPLADGPADADSVAEACGCDALGIGALLDYLACIELLEREDNTYTLTPTAAAFLVPRERTYAGDWVLMETSPGLWESMLDAVRSGHPSHYPLPAAQDAWLESYRSSRWDVSLRMWRAAGIEPGQGKSLRILDLACGCAIKSFALAQADPAIRVACIDRADVLKVARDLAARLRILPQVTFRSEDLHSFRGAAGSYDAVLLGQITYALTPEQNRDLFARVHRALSPGGILLIDAIMASEKPAELASLITFLSWSLSGSAAHSFDQYQDWLEGSGFQWVKRLGNLWLSAGK